jgi:hypothetical protein
MTSATTFVALGAVLAALAGCAWEGPTGNGDAVRAAMASQVVPPQPRAGRPGADGVAAAAAYANYRQSYTAPTPQGESALTSHR